MSDADQIQSQAADDAELCMLQADPELAGMFFAEALDHLGSIESIVLALESAPSDVKLLNDLFRPFHTIKGNAGALGITSVQETAHKVENLLDLARSERQPPGAAGGEKKLLFLQLEHQKFEHLALAPQERG